MTVRIVTDSTACLPPGVAEELGIMIVPLRVVYGEDRPTTSGLSSLELCAAYARQLERGGDSGVVALHLPKEFSSTWSAAVTAAAVFEDKVRVVDTGTVGMSLGAAAMAAAKLALEGASLEECYDLAVDTLERSGTWVYLHRLDELRKSGRLSATTAMFSTALATKPIMRVNDGRFELAAKTRTQTKAFARLVELIVERAAGEPVFLAVQENEARAAARHLLDVFEAALPAGSSFMLTTLDETLSVHAGPGAIGVSAVFATPTDHEL